MCWIGWGESRWRILSKGGPLLWLGLRFWDVKSYIVEVGEGAFEQDLVSMPVASFPESLELRVPLDLTLPVTGPEVAPGRVGPHGRRLMSALTETLRASTFLSVMRTLCLINSCRLA